MTVVLIREGKVTEIYRDVSDVKAFLAKYPQSSAMVVDGDYVEGTLFSNGSFTLVPPPPLTPEPEEKLIVAIRAGFAAAGPDALIAFNARVGGDPNARQS